VEEGYVQRLACGETEAQDYYDKTYPDHGFLYATGTMLAPQYNSRHSTTQNFLNAIARHRDTIVVIEEGLSPIPTTDS
jgi:hypothetical protein